MDYRETNKGIIRMISVLTYRCEIKPIIWYRSSLQFVEVIFINAAPHCGTRPVMLARHMENVDEMNFLSRRHIPNSSCGYPTPSTLPLGHESSPQS